MFDDEIDSLMGGQLRQGHGRPQQFSHIGD
jgi:hypothetical protein